VFFIEDKNDFFLNTKKVKAAEKISKRLIKKIIKKRKEDDFSYYDECVKNQSFSPAFEIKKIQFNTHFYSQYKYLYGIKNITFNEEYFNEIFFYISRL
jgi:lipopolysaccharide biosynthesis glycosyltransferase